MKRTLRNKVPPPPAKEEEEEEDLSFEASISYKDSLKKRTATHKVVPPQTTTTTTTSESLLHNAFSKSPLEGLKAALAQAFFLTTQQQQQQKSTSDDPSPPELLSALKQCVDVHVDQHIKLESDYRALSQLSQAYTQELLSWDQVKALCMRPSPPLQEEEDEFPKLPDFEKVSGEDQKIIDALFSLTQELPEVCVKALDTLKMRGEETKVILDQCEEKSFAITGAFSRAMFDEDVRQPKKVVKLLSGGDDVFSF